MKGIGLNRGDRNPGKAPGLGFGGWAVILWVTCLDTLLIYFGHYSTYDCFQNLQSLIAGAGPALVFWVVLAAFVLSLLFKGRLVMLVIPSAARRPRWLSFIAGLPLVFVSAKAFDYSMAMLVMDLARGGLVYGPLLVMGAGILASLFAAMFAALSLSEGSGKTAASIGPLLVRLLPFAALLGLSVFFIRYVAYVLLVLPLAGMFLLAGANALITVWYFKTLPGMIHTGLENEPPGKVRASRAMAAGLLTAMIVGLAIIVPGPPHHLDAIAPPPLVPRDARIAPVSIEQRGQNIIVESERLTLVVGKDPFEFAVVDRVENSVLLKLISEGDRSADYRGVALNREYRAMYMLPFMGPGYLVKSRLRLLSEVMESADQIQVTVGEIAAEARIGVRPIAVTFSFFDDDILKITVDAGSRSPFRSTSIAFYAGKEEHFMGLGSGGDIDRRGEDVDLVMERGDFFAGPLLSRLTGGRLSFSVHQAGHSWPMPFLFMSRGAGLFMAETIDPRIEVCSRYPDAIRLSGRGGPLNIYLVSGHSPVDIISRLRKVMGKKAKARPKALMPWAIMPEAGPAEVAGLMEGLRESGIPAGFFHVELEAMCSGVLFGNTHCPELEELLSKSRQLELGLSLQNREWLYKGSGLFQQAMDKGYLAVNRVGLPYQFLTPSGSRAMIDFTNPEAAAWRAAALKEIVGLGFDAVLLDPEAFIPPDAVLYNGESGYVMKNLYPLVYAMSISESVGEEVMVMSRYGFAGMGRYLSMVWPLLTDPEDELTVAQESARIACMGASGAPLVFPVPPSSTRAGFNSMLSPLLALPPDIYKAMGNKERDKQIIAQTREIARTHTRLFPYYYSLWQRFVRDGSPVVRPLSITGPSDPELYGAPGQYMIGEALMVAVGSRGSGAREVRFPPGTWVDLETMKEHGEGSKELPLRSGRPLTFLSKGEVLPIFKDPIESLSSNGGEDFEGEALARDIILMFACGERATGSLFDGAGISARRVGESLIASVSGGLERYYTFRALSCPGVHTAYVNGIRLRDTEWEYHERSRVLTVPDLPGPDVELEVLLKD